MEKCSAAAGRRIQELEDEIAEQAAAHEEKLKAAEKAASELGEALEVGSLKPAAEEAWRGRIVLEKAMPAEFANEEVSTL